MDIVAMATQALNESMGLSLDASQVSAALSGLMGDGQGGIDLAGLASKIGQNGNLGELLGSWLGDGVNGALSVESLGQIFGQADLSQFAQQLGVDPSTASQGLADALPQMMDQASSGGSLLESVGGVDGLLGAAKSFLS
ncbi:MAG: YidB family protein [Pseudomonadota bacterium]